MILPLAMIVASRRNLICLAVILVVAATVRFCGITFDSLWLDESYQSMVGACGRGAPNLLSPSQQPFIFRFEKPASLAEVTANFRKVDPLCPPLYAVALNRWMTLFGDCDAAIRSLSVFFSLLSLLLVFAIGTMLFGVEAGLAAAFVQAVSPFDVHYAQEARMYSLVACMSALSTGSLFCLLFGNRLGHRVQGNAVAQSPAPPLTMSAAEQPRGLVTAIKAMVLPAALTLCYAASTSALINSHYTGLFIVFFQMVLAGSTVLSTRNWKTGAQVAVSYLLVLVLWLPWLPMFLESASSRKESFYVVREASLTWPLYALLFKIPVNWNIFLSGPRVGGYALAIYVTSALALVSSAVAGLSALVSLAVTDYGAAAKVLRGRRSSPPCTKVGDRSRREAFSGGSFQVRGPTGKRAANLSGREGAIALRAEDAQSAGTRSATLSTLDFDDFTAGADTAQGGGKPNRIAEAAGPLAGDEQMQRGRALLLVWLWACIPALVLWFLDVMEGRKVIEIARYTMGTAPAIYLLAGAGFQYFKKQYRKGWALLALHALFAFANLYYLHTVHQREPWKEMARTVESVCRPDDLLVVSEYYDIACLDRYLSRPFLQIGASPAMGRSAVEKLLQGRSRFILITAQEGEFIKDILPCRFTVRRHIDLRHGLHLRIYQR